MIVVTCPLQTLGTYIAITMKYYAYLQKIHQQYHLILYLQQQKKLIMWRIAYSVYFQDL